MQEKKGNSISQTFRLIQLSGQSGYSNALLHNFTFSLVEKVGAGLLGIFRLQAGRRGNAARCRLAS